MSLIPPPIYDSLMPPSYDDKNLRILPIYFDEVKIVFDTNEDKLNLCLMRNIHPKKDTWLMMLYFYYVDGLDIDTNDNLAYDV